MIPFLSDELVQDITRALERVTASIIRMTQDLDALLDEVDKMLTNYSDVATALLAEPAPSISSTGSDSNGQRGRGVKRSSDEAAENESPNKISKPNGDHEVNGNNGSDSDNDTEIDMAEVAASKLMEINMNMDRSKTIENLDDWLAQMYNETAKFYTIRKCDHIGTFILYVAIDVTLDESKDDLHVVINSDHLQRPDAIFQLIDDCFRERKVVTLLHIITDDTSKLRENVGRLKQVIKTMIEPIVVHL